MTWHRQTETSAQRSATVWLSRYCRIGQAHSSGESSLMWHLFIPDLLCQDSPNWPLAVAESLSSSSSRCTILTILTCSLLFICPPSPQKLMYLSHTDHVGKAQVIHSTFTRSVPVSPSRCLFRRTRPYRDTNSLLDGAADNGPI